MQMVLKKNITIKRSSYVHSTTIPFHHHSFQEHLVLNRLSSVDSKALGSKDDVELELAGSSAAGTLVLAGGRVVLDGVEVDYEIVLDGEDGVGCEPGVVLGVDLGDDGLVVFVGDLGIELVKIEFTKELDPNDFQEKLTIK
jgi:hypothetical protein